MSTRSFYEILKSTPSASFEELRRNYKQLIIQCHPDKLQPDNSRATCVTNEPVADDPNAKISTAATALAPADQRSGGEFIAINMAWNTLKDPTKRRLYDAELLLTKFQAHSNIFARLTLADMKRCASTATNSDSAVADGEGEGDDECAECANYWYYTYDCRCGGQYIVDESADSEILNRKYTSNNHNEQNKQAVQQKQNNHDNSNDNNFLAATESGADNAAEAICGNKENSKQVGGGVADTVVGGVEGDGDDDVLVECSECSLVIVLN